MRNSLAHALPLLLLLSAPAAADPPFVQVADQAQPTFDAAASFLAIGGDSRQILAQVVVAGVAGSLDEIQLPVRCDSGRLVVEIRTVEPSGEPGVRTLARRSIAGHRLPPTGPPVFRSFLFGRSVRLNVGDAYAIVLSNPSGSCGLPQGPIGDSYLPGEAFFEAAPNPAGWVPFSETQTRLDLPFLTYVLTRP